MTADVTSQDIDAVRAFNRAYTHKLGVLSQRFLDSPYSLTQVRVLYEIAHRPDVLAAELAGELGLDRGYLSRILKGFERRQLLQRLRSSGDGRRRHLRLTALGQRVFAPLERRSQAEVRSLLGALAPQQRQAALGAMRTLRGVLSAQTEAAAAITLRMHRPGDMGWVVARHGALYAQEYGWDERFEALVAQITADFIIHLEPARERCWIAERDGERLGCIFLVAGPEPHVARLRLLLVEPQARGSGLGARLIEECLAFAHAAGYQHVTLWTQASLAAARHLYQRCGFQRVASEPHHSFGAELQGETWELALDGNAATLRRGGAAAKR
jgi:DNA-binding MarR family transcriptional regulator/N-acetylglutamate synthase-like GNAT family acetyltransferase